MIPRAFDWYFRTLGLLMGLGCPFILILNIYFLLYEIGVL